MDFENAQHPLRHDRAARGGAAPKIERLHLLACGTSWHSGLIGKFLIEHIARIPVEVDYGSEYRYRDPIVTDRVLAVGISQSGETADTLSAMEAARERGARLFAVCNVAGQPGDPHQRRGDLHPRRARRSASPRPRRSPPSSWPSTCSPSTCASCRTGEIERHYLDDLARLPHAVDEVIRRQEKPHGRSWPGSYHRAENFLYLGRGINYPIALEGALKLKEISYIHAEGYPAGEMKHGPIALIDENMPVVAIATGSDQVFEKVKSNMQEVKARDGVVIALTDRDPEELGGICDEVIEVPTVSPLLQPIVNVIPLQLLAYFIGVRRGADVDQPRNLAKSVTVE